MKTAISIPDPLFEEADRLAKRLHMSRSQLYSEAVREFVAVQVNREITDTLNRVYSTEDSGVDPVLATLQVSSLPPEEW